MSISLIVAAESELADVGGLPLVVDLDGTLIKSDLLIESFFGRIGKDPASIFSLLLALRHGKARFKSVLAESSDFDAAELPYDEAVLDLIKDARADGRHVYLASASNAKFVAAVAQHLGLFTDYFGSDATTNRSAHAKADLLVEAFGEGGFDYIGNDEADLPVWAAASKRIGVRTSPRLAAKLAVLGVDLIETPKASWKSWTKLIRVHQYAKNALVWLPMFAAHKFDAESIFNSLLATMAFSLCASSVYIFNDLVDLSADRNHPTKKNRPLASGAVPIRQAVALMPLLLLGSIGLAAAVSWPFLGVLLFYFALTNAYTCWLKTKMLIDVVALAMLYSLRVIGGAAAIGGSASQWLLGFSLFFFASLALIKRYIELAARVDGELPDPTNRNYRLRDIEVVGALAAASGFNAVTVFALYISSDAVRPLYRHPEYLWFACPILMYWISRMLMMAHRRLVHDDPIVFALQDRVSVAAGAMIAGVMLAAI
ncbi:MAG: UbiA family prenyltransferase [Methylocella sp.]